MNVCISLQSKVMYTKEIIRKAVNCSNRSTSHRCTYRMFTYSVHCLTVIICFDKMSNMYLANKEMNHVHVVVL